MKKILFFLLTVFALTAKADEVVDVLNQTLTGQTTTTYKEFSGKSSNSDAVYAGQCAGGNSSIQLRSTNSNSGVVTTASGGKVTHIKVTWNTNTANGRTLDVYGSNTAYTQATDLYNTDKKGTKIGSIVYGTSTELDINDDYEYIGFRSNSGAMYLTSVEITWSTGGGETVAVESVSLTDEKGNTMGMYQSLVQGESLQLKAVVAPSNATNKKVTWEVLQEEEVISCENGLVKALAPGRAAVTVTTEDGEKQAAVTFVVTEPQPSTIADFIANEGGTCYLTGVVSNIKNTTYGNFDLTDESGTIYVYGCLTPAGEKQQFESLEIKEGDKITVLASEYQLYKETKEAVNVVFVENHGSAPTYTFDVVADAETFTVTPSDNDVEYYVEIQAVGMEEAVKEFGYNTIEEYYDYLCEEMGDGLECFSGISTQSYEEDWYIDEPGDYSIYVFAVNGDYERVSDIKVVPFTFGSAPACTFDVAIDNDEFTITPSDNDVQYYFELMNVQMMKQYGVSDLTEYMDMTLADMGEWLDYYTGEETEPWSWYMDAEDGAGDYVIAICAVNDNYERTSDVTVIPFSAANMTVTSAGYATFVAPFEVAVPTGVKAYTVEGVEGETLTLTQVSTIAANTPVVLEGALEATLLVGKTVEGTPKAGLLTGVYEETEAPAGSYVLQAQDVVGFYKVVAGQEPTVGVNRAYLTVDSSVKAFTLGGDATAIKSLEALTSGKAQIFDMNGRQINKLQKGINIVNGVKVLVK